MKSKITAPSWLVRTIAKRRYSTLFQEFEDRRVLDIGCGTGEKRGFFPKSCSYTGVDHADSLHDLPNDVVLGTAYALPFEDESFDLVLCTAVLEHLEEPERALREALRVLAPGGVAFYTVPMTWHVHEAPRDFYRFTRFGLDYLFSKVGFHVDRIEPFSGFWVTWGSSLNYYLLHISPRLLRPPLKAWTAATNLLLLGLDRMDRSDGWTANNLVMASKPKAL